MGTGYREQRKRYKIVRTYNDQPGIKRTIATGLTLAEAQDSTNRAVV